MEWLTARAGASSEFYEGSQFHREVPAKPPVGGSASLEAMGGGVHDGIGALPVRILRRLSEPPGGLARRPCGGIVRILRRLPEPPGCTTE